MYLHYVVEFGVKSPVRAARDRYSGLIPMTLHRVGEDLLIGLESFGHLRRCRAARRDAAGPPCSVQRSVFVCDLVLLGSFASARLAMI